MLAVRRFDIPEHTENAEVLPHRRCVVSGESLPVRKLIRFVSDPDGTIIPDVGGTLPGRGLWLTADRAMIEEATSRRLFSKAAKGNVSVSLDLADRTEELLKRRCLNHLGLARRAGLVAAGAQKVKAQVASGQTVALFEASDGSPQERLKIASLAHGAPVVDAFTGAELGNALGRNVVVHVALRSGSLTATLLEDSARYIGLRRNV